MNPFFVLKSVFLIVIGGGNHQSSMPSTSSPTLHAYPSAEPSSAPSECRDEDGWYYDVSPNGEELGCGMVANNPDKLCAKIGQFEYMHKTAFLACCACGKKILFRAIKTGHKVYHF